MEREVKNKRAFSTLLIWQLLFVLFLLIWFFVSIASAMMFDAPGSEKSTGLWVLFYSIMAYPAGLVVGVLGSWICYARGKYRSAYVFNFIPAIWVIPIVAMMGYAFLK
ncbi:MAG: hypothetical protein ACXVPC_12260 [Tumebacillaceae bacterium]